MPRGGTAPRGTRSSGLISVVQHHIGRRHFKRMPGGMQYAPLHKYGCRNTDRIHKPIHSRYTGNLLLQSLWGMSRKDTHSGAIHGSA